ncbi:hypothetical protein, partial [Planotetraspora phitsanulokensis]
MELQRVVPVYGEVTAVQVTEENVLEVAAWINETGQADMVVGEVAKTGLAEHTIDMHTQEGVQRASIGDWVVLDPHGEIYPVLGSVFPRRLKSANA